ncbi:hypothetical protein C8A03DRAFT_32257 [Achaetomium macrosporum]|uniref:Uncharacterized protein n=1 Tax=Achaetomium macrosporum TaxID=79813 RepID=A0AAN7CCX7_9PEZI|nr:hypothetical protein C8A03DRAFT_32257 [Achaetomium macrosporum]
MPVKDGKGTNFKSYETQMRLLAAIIASMPQPWKFDYKTIAKYFGGGSTESAVEHRMRALKAQAEAVMKAAELGLDAADYEIHLVKSKDGKTTRISPSSPPLPFRHCRLVSTATGFMLLHGTKEQALTEATDIHKLFGESTPDGVNWQMRGVKQGAKVLQAARDNGEDPVAAFNEFLNKNDGNRGAGTPATPKHRTPSLTKRARSAGKTPTSGSGTTPASKRRKSAIVPQGEWGDDEDSPEVDYDELDTTPTKLKPKVVSTPRKFPDAKLVPRETWAKPEPGSRPAKRHVPIAPAPPRPAAPSYNLAPIPGVSSATAPHGYSNPSGMAGYNYPASTTTMANATLSTDNSPAMAMDTLYTMRRGSIVSVSSGNDVFGMSDAASPSASASDVNTPQTVSSANAMMVEQQAAAPTQASSIKTEDYISPGYAHFASHAANDNNNDGGSGSFYSFDHNQPQGTGHVNFGDWVHDAQSYDHVGDC